VGELVGQARTITGADATKARLQQELADLPEILHLATHAYFAGQGGCEQAADSPADWAGAGPIAANPLLLSGIVLAGANRDAQLGTDASSERNSGVLTAFEAAGLDLHATRLVVLSACDTGTGLHQRGQEVQGLRWGFRAAGAGALLTSLWRSNDFATRTLMRHFYEALASPDLTGDVFKGAEALRRAQLYNVERERRFGLKKPLVWANFVISGVL
jgi:CHAT domain-containing protein